MNPTTSAVRAITGIYFRRLLTLIILAGSVLFIAAYLLLFYLASSLSPAWWFFLVFLVPATLVGVAVLAGLWLASGKLLPRHLDASERRQVRQFGNKVFGLVETARTPYPLALGIIAKDVMRGRDSSFLKKIIANSSTLRADFDAIRKLF